MCCTNTIRRESTKEERAEVTDRSGEGLLCDKLHGRVGAIPFGRGDTSSLINDLGTSG